jgi:anti-anti-sigma factor
MIVRVEDASTLVNVAIEGDCTIYAAADLRAALLPLVKETRPVMVDLGGITELDCAGLQVLLALQKECALALFSNPAPCLRQALDLLNLNRTFAIEA